MRKGERTPTSNRGKRMGSKQLARLSENEIDAAFADMATDEGYWRDSLELAKLFEKSDWEAYASCTD